MGDDVINGRTDESYLELEAAKYCSKPQRYIYETYALIFEKNTCILSRNNEKIRDARAAH